MCVWVSEGQGSINWHCGILFFRLECFFSTVFFFFFTISFLLFSPCLLLSFFLLFPVFIYPSFVVYFILLLPPSPFFFFAHGQCLFFLLLPAFIYPSFLVYLILILPFFLSMSNVCSSYSFFFNSIHVLCSRSFQSFLLFFYSFIPDALIPLVVSILFYLFSTSALACASLLHSLQYSLGSRCSSYRPIYYFSCYCHHCSNLSLVSSVIRSRPLPLS